MNEIDGLLRAYRRYVALTSSWDESLAGPQRVWFAIYEESEERRLRARLDGFAMATRAAGRDWRLIDLTNAFETWLAVHEYRDDYFENPADLDMAIQDDFARQLAVQLTNALDPPPSDPNQPTSTNTVVAVLGLGALFGLVRASAIVETVAPRIRGRLLGFFPGRKDGSNYRLLNARDGWNYLAVAITAVEE